MKKFRCFIREIHFYNSKTEAFIKTVFLTISWGCGVYIYKHNGSSLRPALFLFSGTLLMEFAMKVFLAPSLKKRLISVIMTLLAAVTFIYSTVAVLNAYTLAELNTEPVKLTSEPPDIITKETAYICTVISLIVIWIDVLSQLVLEDPAPNTTDQTTDIKTNLKNMKIE